MNKLSLFVFLLVAMAIPVSAVTVPLADYKYNVPLYPDTFVNFEFSNDADWGSSGSLIAPTNGYAYYYFSVPEGITSANVTLRYVLSSALDFFNPEPECTDPMYLPSYFGFYVYNFDSDSYDEFFYTSSEGDVTVTYDVNSSQIAPNGTIILRSYQEVFLGNVMCSGWQGDSNLFDVQVEYELSCIPNWSCTGYDVCVEPALNVSCNAVTDLNTCGEVYGGDYSEFAVMDCSYVVAGGRGVGSGGGSVPIGITADVVAPVTAPDVGFFAKFWLWVVGLFS